MKKQLLAPFFALLLLGACTNTEIGNSKDISPDAIAQDFTISYNENDKEAKLKTKFRVSGINGTTLILDAPSQVLLNNTKGKLDSNKFDGAYYQWQIPTESTNNNYSIAYTNNMGKVLTNNFTFNGFALETPMQKNVNQLEDLNLKIKGIANNENLLVVLTDTSKSKSAEYLNLPINNNNLQIPTSDLQKLKKGYVTIEIYYKKSETLKALTKEDGKMTYNYTLEKRDFNLK